MKQFVRIFSCCLLFGGPKRSFSCMNKNYKLRFLTVISSITAPISRFKTALSLTILYLGTTLFLICFISVPHSYSQEPETNATALREKAVKIFLDISRNYEEHVKREITFVNYVRDRKQAQVYVMLTMQRTGAGGMEYTLTLIGQQNFTGINDTLIYVSKQADTQEITRSGLVRILKMGLMPYVAKTPLADYISVNFRLREELTEVVDKWNYWVFNTSISGRANGEAKRKSYSIDANISADRVTPYWKMSFGLNSDYDESSYKTTSDDDVEETYHSYRKSNGFRGLIVKSLGEHLSIGGYSSVQSSIYRNTKFSFSVAPAIEFNLFPYSESTRREFRFLYRIGDTNISYNDTTVYGKTKENLFQESLSITYEIKERWGSVTSTLEGSHYFHNFNKKRLELRSNLSFRIFEGLSLTLNGNIEWIHDQLSLVKGEESLEDILLRQRELSTNYDYNFRVGIRYSFGSIYSNVVNPRFGGGRGQGGFDGPGGGFR